MGSWITCKCGARIHTNMFTGNHIYQLIEDALYDVIEDPVDRDKLEDLFFKKGITVYHCRACGRLLVEWDPKAGPTFYVREEGAAARESATSVGNDEDEQQGKGSAAEGEAGRGESRQRDHARLRELEALAEAEYNAMYESSYPIGCYARAKDAFYDAIALAAELGLDGDVKRLGKRLEHVKEVFRHQFS